MVPPVNEQLILEVLRGVEVFAGRLVTVATTLKKTKSNSLLCTVWCLWQNESACYYVQRIKFPTFPFLTAQRRLRRSRNRTCLCKRRPKRLPRSSSQLTMIKCTLRMTASPPPPLCVLFRFVGRTEFLPSCWMQITRQKIKNRRIEVKVFQSSRIPTDGAWRKKDRKFSNSP